MAELQQLLNPLGLSSNLMLPSANEAVISDTFQLQQHYI
jgi:hypothetical protein